jgi:hypothetical protein
LKHAYFNHKANPFLNFNMKNFKLNLFEIFYLKMYNKPIKTYCKLKLNLFENIYILIIKLIFFKLKYENLLNIQI